MIIKIIAAEYDTTKNVFMMHHASGYTSSWDVCVEFLKKEIQGENFTDEERQIIGKAIESVENIKSLKKRTAMAVVRSYESFDPRRKSNPWVADIGKDGKINFSSNVGGYTGMYGKGEAGDLYINEAIEGKLYAYGQKDYKVGIGNNHYVQFENGEFVEIDKKDIPRILIESKNNTSSSCCGGITSRHSLTNFWGAYNGR